MYEHLINYINNHSSTPLSEGDISVIKEVFVPRKLRKRQYFLQEGEVCKYLGFIITGAVRLYTVDDKGVEHIVQLGIENWWTGDRESFNMLTPSMYNIDAWEDTQLLTTTKAEANRLFTIPALLETFRIMDVKHAIAMQKRINASLSLTAEQRYAKLADSHPEFLQRFPQHIIASYLGITKETLSRVRKRFLSK